MSFSAETTAEQVADTFAREIAGKNVLITGTSIGGLGFETARVIAKYANLLVITGYNHERLQQSEDAIKKEFPTANIRKLTLDLSSLAAVRVSAAEVNAYPEQLHVLINNAVAPFVSLEVNADGLEYQMATGHLGPFLFTNLLAPKLIVTRTSTYTPRVVFVSSLGHAMGPGVHLDTFAKLLPGKYTKVMEPYVETKSANIMNAIELSRRAQGKLLALSLHPGAIETTATQRPASKAMLTEVGMYTPDGERNRDAPIPWKTMEQGAATTVVAAFDPSLSGQCPPHFLMCLNYVANELIAPHTSDPESVKKVWILTEEAVGQSFEF
ncbi:hypothetical protein FB45DRAFT_1032969 [Roridomyces roridus]|uniref:Uncharacterized protein n=1 Tax=Roridomyces roridus TaxID=1738132 RepID=A0AAD7BH30_9AGAR|nr:hypothetical protein FB45DRAFT_1032969 [Roridomyces roridus]